MTSLELGQYRDWLTQRRNLAQSGGFSWTWVQTHLPDWYTSLIYDRPGAGHPFTEPIGPQPEQIRLLTYIAVGSGCRGLGFWSDRFLADSHTGQDRLLTLAPLKQGTGNPGAAADDLHSVGVDRNLTTGGEGGRLPPGAQ